MQPNSEDIPSNEFRVIGGTDADLWGDIDSPADDAWAETIRTALKLDQAPTTKELHVVVHRKPNGNGKKQV